MNLQLKEFFMNPILQSKNLKILIDCFKKEYQEGSPLENVALEKVISSFKNSIGVEEIEFGDYYAVLTDSNLRNIIIEKSQLPLSSNIDKSKFITALFTLLSVLSVSNRKAEPTVRNKVGLSSIPMQYFIPSGFNDNSVPKERTYPELIL
jgi:hypothetical protein